MFQLYLTYVSTEKEALENFWNRSRAITSQRRGSSTCKPESQLGRIEVLFFADNKVALNRFHETDFKPLAIHLENDLLHISATDNNIYILDDSFRFIKIIANRLFNSIHTIRKLGNCLYLSSTGIDSILKANDLYGSFVIIWKAMGTKYGYFPDGIEREIDYKVSHNETTYPTLQQTTHINSCEPYIDNSGTPYLFSTLFHQGVVLKINMCTGDSEEFLRDLDSPHSFRIYNALGHDLAIVCDSNNNKVLLDIDLVDSKKGYRVLEDNFKWVQDAGVVENKVLWVLDANNYRVAFYDYVTLRHIVDYCFNTTYRIFSATARMD